MLPSIASPLVSLASTSATLAQPLLGAVVSTPKSLAGAGAVASIKTALDVADSLLEIADKVGILPSSKKATAQAKSSGAGYAQGATASKTPSKASTTKTSTTKSSKTSTAKTSTTKTTSTAKKSGPLAFLDDPKLSVEDKLMRLLAYLNGKWQKDIDKKLKEIGNRAAAQGADAAASGGSGSTKAKGGGVLGGIVKAASAFLPGVGIGMELLKTPAARTVLAKIGAPVLAAAATATGFPELAPLALQYGPKLADLAAGIATAIESDASTSSTPTATSSGTSAGASKSDGAGLSSDKDAQLQMMQVQRLMDQQKEMFALVSNILRSGHDTRMAVIQNVR
jgi:hypothetical protein